MDIYWIQEKKRRGPVTVPDALSLIQTGELTPETLGWHAGCPKWVPLRELPALADFLQKREEEETPLPGQEDAPAPEEMPEAAPAEEPQPQPEPPAPAEAQAELPPQLAGATRVYLPSPTARLLARLVDYGLYTALYYGVLCLREVPYNAALLLSVNPLLWLPMVAIEAWMLSTWGTTPGKALMGIRVTTFGEAPRLGYMRALMRSLMVFTLGMGVMMPQIMPLMIAFSYWVLRRRGITGWDARCSTLPVQKVPALPSRYVLAVISLYVCAVLAASCVQPWFSRMVDDIEKGSPELARTLRQYLPEEAPATSESPAATSATPGTGPAAAPIPAEPAPAAPNDTALPGI